MANPTNYTIQLSDGNSSFSVDHSNIDDTQCSITLIGQNTVDYGDDINRNFVHVMEHFAKSDPPANPIRGQLWFRTLHNYDAGFSWTDSDTSKGDFGDGDFLPRIYVNRSLTGMSGTGYWTTLPTTIVDSAVPSTRQHCNAHPGQLWLDVNTSDDAVPVTNTYYDHSILKVFDPISGTWLSVAANHVLLKGNQTITGNIIIDGEFEVNDATTLNSTLDVTGATTLNSTLDVTGATTLNSTLVVTSTSTFNATATFAAVGAGISVTNDCSIGGSITVANDVSVGDLLTADTLNVIHATNMTDLLTISVPTPSNAALDVSGDTIIRGNVSISAIAGGGNGELTTASNVLIGDSLTVTNNLTVATGIITCLDIDVTNHTVKNLSDPTNPQEAATKNYIDSHYLRRDVGSIAAENAMTATLILDVNLQTSSPNCATTKQYVDDGLYLKFDKTGGSIAGLVTIDVGGVGTGLNVVGDINVTAALTTNVLLVNSGAVFNGDFNARNTLKVYADRASFESKYIESVGMRTSPVNTDVPNVGYVTNAIGNIQDNFAKINPTATPKPGDLRIITSPLTVSIYADDDWRQIYPAVYA